MVPTGGGTNYWPGSLNPIHEYMLAHPDEYAAGTTLKNSWSALTTAGETNTMDKSQTPDTSNAVLSTGPSELTGSAGDVFFMHAYTVTFTSHLSCTCDFYALL